MNLIINKILPYIVTLSIVVGSFVIGFIVEKIIIRKILANILKNIWKSSDIIINALKRKTRLLVLLLGVFIGIQYLPIDKTYFDKIHKTLAVLSVFIISLIIANISVGYLQYNRKGKSLTPVISIIATIIKIFILILGFLIILNILGLTITPLLTALGVTGLAVALALQDTLSNIFSGIYIIATKQINVGNYIEIDKTIEGHVRDITWRNTTVETLPNNMIIIPNSKLASSVIINYSFPKKELKTYVKVGVSYGSDLEKVERVTIETGKKIMQTVSGAVPEFDPFIRYHTFNDFSIDFTVVLKVNEFVEKYRIQHEFMKELHKRFKKEKITIPFPIRTVELQNKENND